MADRPTLFGIENSVPVARNPFFEIYVKNRPRGGTIVYWGLRRDFLGRGPYTFELQWAESNEADWETVTAVVDTYWAEDPERRLFAKAKESWYRIKLSYFTPTGDPREEYSTPHQATGVWNKRDWLVARDICRKEQLLAKKFTGRAGYILKRKVWGEVCPECADYDTGEVSNGHCPVCFGTGKRGGYWPGHLTYAWEMQSGASQQKKINDNVGMVNNRGTKMRALAYPNFESYDIFVDEQTGERFVIREVSNVANIKGIPLVNVCEFRLAPYTDIVYEVPIVPPEYTEPEAQVITTVVQPEGVIEIPETAPDPLDDPAPEPTSEPEEPQIETELHVPTEPYYGVWWEAESQEWYIGTTIGDETSALYRTNDAQSNPFFLDAYEWTAIGGGPGFVLTLETNGFTITGDPAVAGSYLRSGTYDNAYAYLQQET